MNKKTAIQKLFESHFKMQYCDETLIKLGYRFDSGCGYVYKFDEEVDMYVFCSSLDSSESYDEQVMRNILMEKLGDKLFYKLEDFFDDE